LKPWCQIDNATQNSTAHYFFVAKGAYGQVTHTQNPTTMYFLGPGPGLTDPNSAVIAENNKAPISINAGGNTLDLTFDGTQRRSHVTDDLQTASLNSKESAGPRP
jgi:hypothetical protein